MTDDDLAGLERLHDAMQAAARSGDRHEVAVRDAAFHAGVLQLARNATLERVWRSLEPFSRTYITLVSPGADPQWTADLHLPIIRALLERDAEQAVAALQRHFRDASERLAGGWQGPTPGP
jgi:DNA-binding GntR family transcriptional regulator